MKDVKIFLACDHAGFKLKEKIKNYLHKKNHAVQDFGAFKLEADDDYPDYIFPCAQKVAKTKNALGIILGASGQGEAIVANKVNGIRAAVFYGGDQEILELSKEHNNANILSLGARFLSEEEALLAIDVWLNAKFSQEVRHKRRIKKIEKFEGK